MLSISNKAVERLREELIHRCFQTGIGFRILVTSESGKATFSIKFDRQRQGDKVIESDGVKVFLDLSSAGRIKNYQLDCPDEPGGGLFLKIMQETKDKQE